MSDPGHDALSTILEASREDLLAALSEAEKQLAAYRQAAAALESRISLVQQLLGIGEKLPPSPGPADVSAAAAEKPKPVPLPARPLKYDGLVAWLRQQPRRPMEMSFRRIEEAVGMSLPPSCRRYPAHWHGWDGSAVARAIQTAGWGVRNLNIAEEYLVFVPQPEYRRAHE